MAPEAPPSGRLRRVAAGFLKIAAIAVVVVAVVGATGAAFISSRYFPAAVEARLAKSMLDTKRRVLKFDGPLEIFFWPNAGFKAGHISLSEPGGVQEFAALDAARFSVAVAPLLHGRIVIDDCSVEGLRAVIVRRRDGSLNIDDLFAGEQSSTTEFTVDAAGVRIGQAAFTWIDEASGARAAATGLELTSGRLQADMTAKTLQADNLSLAGTINGVQAHLDATGLAASPAALAAERAALKLDYQSGDTAVGGSLNARLAADPEHRTIALETLTGDIEVAHPRLAKPLKLPLRGGFKAGRDQANGALTTRFDESTAVLKFAIPSYSPPALRFDVEIDRLDVGRYLSPNHAAVPAEEKERPSTLDFSALDGLELDGTARIGSLRIAGIETRNIKLEIRGKHGKLSVRGIDSKGR